jgi:hypothetical protein
MLELAQDSYQFNLGQTQYHRVRMLSVFFLGVSLLGAVLFIVAGIALWGTYSHDFTPYLKWQDALLALCWFLGGFVCLGGSVLIGRFMHALHSGYHQGMVAFQMAQAQNQSTITVRDLSPENLKSILWIANSSFWCFFVALLGLTPIISSGWTLRLTDPILSTAATSVAVLLSVAGVVISIVAVAFILVGVVGVVPFTRKLGSSHTYQLNGQATVRIDDFVLTIVYPGMSESMVDLHLLSHEDQQQVLALLHRRWMDAQQSWNPSLGEEIAQALELTLAS